MRERERPEITNFDIIIAIVIMIILMGNGYEPCFCVLFVATAVGFVLWIARI